MRYIDDGNDSAIGWLVVIVRVPSEPSRHRVAVWRELRRAGAVQLSPGTWALPDLALNAEVVDRVRALAAEGAGEATVLRVVGTGGEDDERLRAAYAAARGQDWAELCGDCEKLLAEIDAEIGKGKLTLAELEEEEQSLDRLRRWHRTLRVRDVLGPSAGRDRADELLERCGEAISDFERRVFEATSPE
jgi:hypothetical protein